MNDTITLTVPHARPYHGVVRLVVGGLAARLDLPLEALEDVQLALESLLANSAYAGGEEITVEVTVEDGALDIVVGPFDAARLGAELERDVGESDGVGLGRLLATVVGEYELDGRGGEGGWIRMRKELPERRATAEAEA
jgi:anti-sigma regulatory factor (Ser/Thr protein kinase)